MGNKKKDEKHKNFKIPSMTRTFNIPQQHTIPKMPPVAPPKKNDKSSAT